MIRSTLKRGIKRVLGIPSRPEPAPAPPVRPVPPPSEDELNQVAEAIPFGGPEDAEDAEDAPAGDAPAEDAETDGLIALDEVQEILDDMVRPALQADGGDITLVKIENNDIYVRLVGSCSSCPSSIMTMKMGVEALLKEEFPSMGELIQVQ